MWSLLALCSVAWAQSGCVGYVEKPENVPLKFKDTKVQAVNPETGKVLVEAEVASNTGMWYLDYNSNADGLFTAFCASYRLF